MLERKENETALAHHKRLVYGKLVDKTLSDVDYTELAPYVYGQEYSADVARRMLYGSRMTLQLMDAEHENAIQRPDILRELNQQKIEIAKERQRFFDQRREFNKMIASEGRREHLEDRLVSAANELSKTVSLSSMPVGEHKESDSEAILVLSDWHYGMITHNVFNEYNTDICKRRVATIVNKAIRRIDLHECNVLHVVVLGDLFHGAIHTSARVMSEELVCDQLMQVSELLAQAIAQLSEHAIKTIVHITYGNHARTVQSKNDNIHRDNMERIVPWWLKERLSALSNIVIEDERKDEFITMNVCGHGFCASHGDLDGVRSSPRLISTLFHKKYGFDVEYILLGDKHHMEAFSELGIRAMIVDSLCGTDDYANDHRLYSTPGQLLLIVNPEEGIDASYCLKAD